MQQKTREICLYCRVHEYIPVRSSLPRHVGGAKWAVNDFQQQVASIAGQLVSEFRTLCEEWELEAQGGAGGQGSAEGKEGTGLGRAGVREGSSTRKTEAEERSECKSMFRLHPFIFFHPTLQTSQVHISSQLHWEISRHQGNAQGELS